MLHIAHVANSTCSKIAKVKSCKGADMQKCQVAKLSRCNGAKVQNKGTNKQQYMINGVTLSPLELLVAAKNPIDIFFDPYLSCLALLKLISVS